MAPIYLYPQGTNGTLRAQLTSQLNSLGSRAGNLGNLAKTLGADASTMVDALGSAYRSQVQSAVDVATTTTNTVLDQVGGHWGRVLVLSEG